MPHVRKHGTNAGELQDLIQRVLHHPDFNADEVNHDLHERLMKAVEQGDIEVIDMWEKGDGPQDNTFVKRKVAKVLRELLSDERMAGRQHFGFKLSTDANGERVCALNSSSTAPCVRQAPGGTEEQTRRYPWCISARLSPLS